MTKRIKIEEGYTVPPQYITLEDGEELCPDCNGTRKEIVAYMHDCWRYGLCRTCGGTGKIYYCKSCGIQHPSPIIKHGQESWMDGLCLECIVIDDRFQYDKKKQIIDEVFDWANRKILNDE